MCPCVIPTSYSQAYHMCKSCPDARACLLCSNDDYVLALTDGAFNKLLQIQLVRKVEGEQFFGVSLHVLGKLLMASVCMYILTVLKLTVIPGIYH